MLLGTRTEALLVQFPPGRITLLSVAIALGINTVICLLRLCSFFRPLHTAELGVKSGISKSEPLGKTSAEFLTKELSLQDFWDKHKHVETQAARAQLEREYLGTF